LMAIGVIGITSVPRAFTRLYGQQLLDRALANVINFPVVYSVAGVSALLSLVIVTAAAAVIVAIPGYLAAGVAPAVALQD
jgi:hypothetical protein